MEQSLNKKGFALVEMLLAMLVLSLFVGGIFTLSLSTNENDSRIESDSKALLYAQEGIEAVRNMRDRNFLNITDGDHGLSLTNNVWGFIAAPEVIDSLYERTVTISSVYRNESGDVVENGTLDADTKKVVSTVAWDFKGIFPRTVSLSTYVSNWGGDDSITTTCTEYQAGTFSNTEAIAMSAPPADNCSVQLTMIESQSQTLTSANVGEHGNDVVVNGNYAFVATDKSQEGVAVVDVSNVGSPVVVKKIDVGAKATKIVTDGTYLYVGVEKSSKGLAIINASNPPTASLVSTLNVGAQGNDLAISGNYLYMGTEQDVNSFKVISVANKNAPSVVSQLNYGGIVKALALHGTYAYVGINNDASSFKVIDISNPLTPVKSATLNVGGSVTSITISGTYAYVGTTSANNSLKIVDISNPLVPVLVATLDVGGALLDSAIAGDYLYTAVDSTNAGFASVNISNPLQPVLVYSKDITGKASGIAVQNNSVYIAIDVSNTGLVLTGTTIVEASISGSFTSVATDTGSVDTRYNNITWDSTNANGGSLTFHIRTASTLAGLATARWVGSDGTPNTSYTTPRTIIVRDTQSTGPRFFQVKASFTSNGLTSPVLDSLKVNYTP